MLSLSRLTFFCSCHLCYNKYTIQRGGQGPMLYGIKGQLTLKPTQQAHVLQNIGNARFVWNQFLNMWNQRYENNPSLPTLGGV